MAYDLTKKLILSAGVLSVSTTFTWDALAQNRAVLGFEYDVKAYVTVGSTSGTYVGSVSDLKITREGKVSGELSAVADFPAIESCTLTFSVNFDLALKGMNKVEDCNYVIGTTAVNKLIRPYESCTLAKCLDNSYFEQTDGLGSYYGKPYSSTDGWNERVYLQEYNINNSINSFVKPGTNPQFNRECDYSIIDLGDFHCNWYYYNISTSAKIISVIYTKEYLQILLGGIIQKTLYASAFSDGVVPTKIIVGVQGGGGAGANGNWNTGSGGGGAGGFWCGIIDLTCGHTTIDGSGKSCWGINISVGAGGVPKGTGENDGGDGGDTTIYSTGQAEDLIIAWGGTGGTYGGTNMASGGQGNRLDSRGNWTLCTYTGGKGGTRGSGSNSTGGSTSSFNIYATNITSNKTGKNVETISAKSGGAGGSGSQGGGGGASIMHAGGDYGQNNGHNGYYGSGGGGASSQWGSNPIGGNGGGGVVILWF